MQKFWAAVAVAAAMMAAPAARSETLADALISAYKTSHLLDKNQAVLRAADEDAADTTRVDCDERESLAIRRGLESALVHASCAKGREHREAHHRIRVLRCAEIQRGHTEGHDDRRHRQAPGQTLASGAPCRRRRRCRLRCRRRERVLNLQTRIRR